MSFFSCVDNELKYMLKMTGFGFSFLEMPWSHITTLSACNELAPVSAANRFIKDHAVCYCIYVIMHLIGP